MEPLVKVLQDEDLDVRMNAAWALGAIGDPRAVEPLIKALEDEHLRVRGTAASALIRIDPGWWENSAVKSVIAEVFSALKDEDPTVRSNAAWVLGEIQDPKAVEPLIEALKDENSWVRQSAAGALEKITKEHFGREVAKWEEWLKKQKAGE